MKTLIHLCIILFGLNLSSCNDIEDEQVITHIVYSPNKMFDFSNDLVFYEKIDMNHDGTVDFIFAGLKGQDGEQPELGSLTTVRVFTANPYNRISAREEVSYTACDQEISYYPIDENFDPFGTVQSTQSWSGECFIYGQLQTSADCTHSIKHYHIGAKNTIGVQFQNEGYTFHGWIKIVTSEERIEGNSELSRYWTLSEYGFYPIPNMKYVNQ